MNLELAKETLAFEAAVVGALKALGGDDLVHRAELEPAIRAELISPALGALGVWDLSPRLDAEELEAAAVACRAAGRFAVPYPVAERLAALPGVGDGLLVTTATAPLANVAHVHVDWITTDLGGRFRHATPTGEPARGKLAGFLAPIELGEVVVAAPSDAALALVLPCWTLLGMLDRAFELTHRHVRDRTQFGKPLLAFQVVQFQLADAVVAVQGFEEMAKYSLWSSSARTDESVADALALRLVALEAADLVFRAAHQLHGAIGFCDESPLSWLSRHSQALRRHPFGLTETEQALTRLVTSSGLSGLYAERSTSA